MSRRGLLDGGQEIGVSRQQPLAPDATENGERVPRAARPPVSLAGTVGTIASRRGSPSKVPRRYLCRGTRPT